jgi:AcrR family transcriptional regulator
MITPSRHVDRRTQRTRQVLQQAFRELVQDKGFTATSIREITERANVNRGTFYLHFADKYSLAETMVREVFYQKLIGTLPTAPEWERHCLRMLIQAVLGCLEEKYRHQPRPLFALAEVAPLVERAMREELAELLLTWLKQGRCAQIQRSVPLERLAQVVSWAIFGTALQWSQEATAVSAEEIGNTILLVVMEGVAHLVPEFVPA